MNGLKLAPASRLRRRPGSASRIWSVFFNTVCLLAFPVAALGQLSVVSTIPTDGATSVDTAATFEFTFSAPLDTSARFAWPPEFFLGLALIPDTLVGEPDSIALSPDLKTVRVFNLHLWPQTRYVFGILGARSTTGQLLEKPAVITFTTGTALPTATVSGTITYPGGDPTGTVVALFRNLFEENPEALSVVSSSTGTYTVNYVPGGTYWPVAVKDVDRSGDFEPEPGVDVIALYDPNGDGFADSLVVPEGGAVTGVNMTLAAFAAMTARQRYPDAQSVAQNWSADARPVAVGSGEISASGESGIWIYVFYSPSRLEYFGIMAASVFLAPFPWEDEPPDTTALPPDWLDSDVAADSAEAHGGSDFRATHPDAETSAFLANVELPGLSSAFRTLPIPGLGYKSQAKAATAIPHSLPGRPVVPTEAGQQRSRFADDRAFSLQQRTLSQSLQGAWVFQYFSEASGDFVQVFLDAITGEFIFSFPPRATTARANLSAANQAAQTWAADAQMVMLANHQSSLDPAGEAAMWFFLYYSASLDSAQAFILGNGVVFWQGNPGWEPPSKVALPSNWIDSGLAIAVAETHGGAAYRAAQQDVWVQAWLSRNFYPWDPSRAVWSFNYNSTTAPPLGFWVDAVSGALLTGVESQHAGSVLPQRYALGQNYPNPFNATTLIEYQLPKRSQVELSIHNLSGEKVVTLVKQQQEAGVHRVSWQGADEMGRGVASGVYLYRLRAGDYVATRKLLLLR